MKKKFNVLIIVLITLIIIGSGIPTYLWAKEKQINKTSQESQLVQSIIANIAQSGGQIVNDSNGMPAIYVPQKTYVTVWEDKEYRHIGLWVDGILFADRQIPLTQQQPNTNPSPSPSPSIIP